MRVLTFTVRLPQTQKCYVCQFLRGFHMVRRSSAVAGWLVAIAAAKVGGDNLYKNTKEFFPLCNTKSKAAAAFATCPTLAHPSLSPEAFAILHERSGEDAAPLVQPGPQPGSKAVFKRGSPVVPGCASLFARKPKDLSTQFGELSRIREGFVSYVLSGENSFGHSYSYCM